jgi:hypothetical protein
MRITALLVSTVIAAGLIPATSAAAATESDYCMAIITTGQSWCAATEAELDAIRSRQLGSRSIAPAATSHLVDLYDAANRTGAYYALYGTECDTNADLDGSYTLPSSWNDRISSFQGFGNCESRRPDSNREPPVYKENPGCLLASMTCFSFSASSIPPSRIHRIPGRL